MKEKEIKIKNATISDIDSISKINNALLKYSNKNGFIISKLDNRKIKHDILKNPDSIKVAITSSNTLAGFIILSESVGAEVISKLEWFDQKFKTVFEKSNKLYIEKIAVNPDYQRQNVGKLIYETIIGMYSKYMFYSFIVKKPFYNAASFNFHKSLGFIEAAKFKSDDFLGFKNYESSMLFKYPE